MRKPYVKQQREIISEGGEELRLCSSCMKYLPHSQFYLKKSGLSYSCIPCENERGRVKNPHKTARQLGVKTCRKCLIEKPVSEFREHTVHGKHHGFHSWCKECEKIIARKKNDAIRDKKLASAPRCSACGNIMKKGFCQKCLEIGDAKWREVRAKKWQERVALDAKKESEKAERIERRIQRKQEKIIRQNRTCKICGSLVGSGRSKYCTHCSSHEVKYQLDSEYREKMLQDSREWREKNKETINARKRQYLKDHPEKRREKERRREMKKKGIPGSHTEQEWKTLLDLCDNRCVFCGNEDLDMTRDHIIPITLEGSTDYIQNIQPACRKCNSSKGNREIVDRRPEKAVRYFQ